jgi:hypothetical protein
MHCSLVSKVVGSVRVLVAGEELKHLGFLFVLDVGKRMRKPVHRRTVDYSSTVVRYIQVFFFSLLFPFRKAVTVKCVAGRRST